MGRSRIINLNPSSNTSACEIISITNVKVVSQKGYAYFRLAPGFWLFVEMKKDLPPWKKPLAFIGLIKNKYYIRAMRLS